MKTRIELTISSEYRPNWGVWDGLREIFQNGIDAKAEFGGELRLEFRKNKDDPNVGTVTVRNISDAELPRASLLLGVTTKAGNSNYIGQFGDGLKIGALALSRLNHNVTVRTGNELWAASIIDSASFGIKVLAFDISKARKINGVLVSVSNIRKLDYDLAKSRFLHFNRKYRNLVSEGSGVAKGAILYESEPKLYVDGIYVQDIEGYTCGYNINGISVGADRNIASLYEVNIKLSSLWRDSINQSKGWSTLIKILDDPRAKEHEFSAYPVSSDSEYAKRYSKLWLASVGRGKFPYHYHNDDVALASSGVTAVLVSSMFEYSLLVSVLGAPSDYIERRKALLSSSSSWYELTVLDKRKLDLAKDLVGIPNDHVIDVIAYPDSVNVMGYCNVSSDSCDITLNKTTLSDMSVLITVLIHEYAHAITRSGDNTSAHCDAITSITKGCITRILQYSVDGRLESILKEC